MSEKREYSVVVLIDAMNTVKVVATSPEEAAEMAEDMDEANVTLCHSCSRLVEVADPIGCHVYDVAQDKLVLNTSLPAQQLEKATALLHRLITTPAVKEVISSEDYRAAIGLLTPELKSQVASHD